MITVRNSADRGHAKHGWLDSYHTFSFADYYDRNHLGVANLRVINEDRVIPGAGFPAHSHQNMEIVSYVLEGALEHRDSMGNHSVIRPGEVQRMSAGTGVTHSEYNASQTEPVRFLQIWLLPNQQNSKPGYEQKLFTDEEKRGRLCLLVSPDGREGSVTAHQDGFLYATLLAPGERVRHALTAGRTAYLQVIRGEVTVNGQPLTSGDGATVRDELEIDLSAAQATEVLLFDLP
jgi:redox-sensitive bicupin YhaK (pirin superfamily)